ETAGSKTFTATDTTDSAVTGTSPAVSVGPAGVSSLRLAAATTTPAAGVADDLTVTALDPFGNVATGYTGDHVLTFGGAGSSAAPATPPTVTDKNGSAQPFASPTTLTFSNGVATVSGGGNGALTLYKVETATITVDDGAHGNGAGLALTVTAAAPTRLAADVNGGSTPTAGLAFAVDLRVLDAYGNASAVAAPTSVTLSRAAGTGTLGGSLSGTIAAGQSQKTIGGVTYSKAEPGVQLTATRTSGDNLTSANSAVFTVSSIADRLV